MAEFKITHFIIALLLISLIAAGIGMVVTELGDKYNQDYNGTFSSYNYLDKLSDETKGLKKNVTGIKEKSGVFDVIGGFFSDAYKVLKMTKNSYSSFGNMTDTALDQSNLGEFSEPLRMTVSAIILVIILIGIITAAIVKRDL